jgi:hypothetical protein
MKMTIKVSLDAEKSLGFGVTIQHCGKYQLINCDMMQPGQWWECSECEQPILLVTESGWFEVGNRILI